MGAMAEALFKVSNHHTEACGDPPCVDGDAEDRYVGYFVNEHGEQSVYEHDRETGHATLRMGDASWGEHYRVVEGTAIGLNVSKPEAMWVEACWKAATGRAR